MMKYDDVMLSAQNGIAPGDLVCSSAGCARLSELGKCVRFALMTMEGGVELAALDPARLARLLPCAVGALQDYQRLLDRAYRAGEKLPLEETEDRVQARVRECSRVSAALNILAEEAPHVLTRLQIDCIQPRAILDAMAALHPPGSKPRI